jgi:hypothetical protein
MRISPLVRFVLACSLFAGWIGWLIWMVATTRHQVVLSRPQLLVSEIDVVAKVSALDEPVIIEEVLHSSIKDSAVVPGASLPVINLAVCKRLPHEGEDPRTVPLDWTGPGTYLLPLRTTNNAQSYAVAETPASPGYPPPRVSLVGSPRIYPVNDEVREQYREIRGSH